MALAAISITVWCLDNQSVPNMISTLLGVFVFRRSSKHDLTKFLEYNTWTGTFRLGLEPWCEEAQGIRRLAQSRSYVQESFSMMAENVTDLKRKRLFRPRWITIESLANVKGMGVILHGLRPVPINRWTVLPYCSRWLGICFCVTLVLLPSFKPKVYL